MLRKNENRFRQIGLNIKSYRQMKNLTQESLAEVVGISRTHLSNIEAPNVPTSISLLTLFTIADALDVEPAELLKCSEPK